MEVKEERTDGGERHETYTILMEPDALMRHQRSLRREICVSRVVLFVLLVTCMALCAALCVQQIHESKNTESPDKENQNETWTENQIAEDDQKKSEDDPKPVIGFVSIAEKQESGQAFLQWKAPEKTHLKNISLDDSGKILIIPNDGIYRISLQITYGEANPKEANYINLAHNIIKWSKSYPEDVTILSVHEFVYTKTAWFKSMFSNIIYDLNEGDKIKVKVDKPELLDISGSLESKSFLIIQLVSRTNPDR